MAFRKLFSLVLAFTYIYCVSAQEKNQVFQSNGFQELMAAEKQHYLMLEGFQPTGAGSNFDVKYHRLEWTVDPAVRYLKGKVTTYFKTTELANQISFDLDTIFTIDSVKYHGNSLTFNKLPAKILQINLSQAIPINTLDSVSVFYKGVPPTTGFGSYEQRLRNNTSPETWTLSEPYGGRDWWPGKMDLTDKIDSIDVIITTPPQYRAASNGLLVEEYVNASQSKVYRWKHRYPIANYLVCMAVTNYEQFSDKIALSRGDSLFVLNYAYAEEFPTIQNDAKKVYPIIRLYDSLIGDYPFKKEKYGQCRFGWGGGQEHQTFTFLVNYSTGLMAHELAHQWFGDKITCGSWSEIWLNEGFATFMDGVHYEVLEPNLARNFWQGTLNSATNPTSGSTFVDDTTSVNRIFSSALTYNKGAYLLRMLRYKLGDGAFFNGMRAYAKDPSVSYGFSRITDFKRNMEAAGGQDLTEFFKDWFYGQGYPTYNISYSTLGITGNCDITVKQTQSHPSVSFFDIPIPIKFTGALRDTTVMINPTFSNQIISVDLKKIGTITNAVFDPDIWILSKNNTISRVTVSTQDIDNQRITSIFPNPIDKNLNVVFENMDNHLKANIEVINALGAVVFNENKTIISGKNTFNLSLPQLTNGVYFLKISTQNLTATKKFIKQN